MSLALVSGIALGYVRWGLEARRLRETVARPPEEGQRSAEPQRWTGRGVVRMLLREQGVVFLTQEGIPGVMAGATRAFQAASPQLLTSFAPGDPVRFTLERRGMGHLLVAIEKVN